MKNVFLSKDQLGLLVSLLTKIVSIIVHPQSLNVVMLIFKYLKVITKKILYSTGVPYLKKCLSNKSKTYV